jgi:hypothetical protein
VLAEGGSDASRVDGPVGVHRAHVRRPPPRLHLGRVWVAADGAPSVVGVSYVGRVQDRARPYVGAVEERLQRV